MKKTLLALLIALFAVSCGSRHNISADIKGQGDMVLVYAEDLDGNEQTDTIPMKKGRFTYDIPESMSDPVFIYISLKSDLISLSNGDDFYPSSKNIDLIMSRNNRIAIKGESAPEGMMYTVKGSEINSGLAAHNKEFLPLRIKADSLSLELYNLPGTEENSLYAHSLNAKRGEYTAKMISTRKKYIQENPDHELSAYYVARYIPVDSLEYYLSLLTPSASDGFLKPYVENRKQRLAEYQAYIKSLEPVTEGVDAPAFTLADRDGNAVSLSDIKTDYIVLDFWGSWCGYCIAGFPKMKEYYAKYAGKVEFVGIDCRDTHEKWIAALDEYELPWMQVIDNPDGKTAVQYAIKGYPTKILIGPDRKIAAVYIGETDDFYLKLDDLFK